MSASGQKIRFSDSTNKWKIIYIHGWPIESMIMNCHWGTTKIKDSIEYRLLLGSTVTAGDCLIREDTIAAKVYVRILPNYGGSGIDSTEQVLYDYNWQVGDTVIRNVREYYKHVITRIDSTMINSNWHKVWHFQEVTISSKDFDVIEGLGCTDDPIFPLFPMNFESASKILCFSNNSTIPFISPSVGGYFDNVTSCSLSLSEIKQREVAIYPNPVNGYSKLLLPDNITCGTLSVHNTLGQTILNTPFEHKSQLLIGDQIKVPGMYYYRVTDADNGVSFSGKFVLQ